MSNESQFGFQRPLKAPILYVLKARYIVRRNCSLGIARGMVCTAAFVPLLVTTLLGIESSRVEEASSFSTPNCFFLHYTPGNGTSY